MYNKDGASLNKKQYFMQPAATWQGSNRAQPFNPLTKMSRLCLTVKYHLMYNKDGASLNKRTAFYAACRQMTRKQPSPTIYSFNKNVQAVLDRKILLHVQQRWCQFKQKYWILCSLPPHDKEATEPNNLTLQQKCAGCAWQINTTWCTTKMMPV